jgi:uncharacterized membrane protein YbhN (UPF0104 family)
VSLATADGQPAPERPLRGPARRILFIVACIVASAAAANLLGWDIRGWFENLWDTITSISAGYVVAGVIAETVKTLATAFAWYTIIRYAYPGEVRLRVVVAGYAVCVALNAILPANLGTIVMFMMLIAVIPSATFAGLLGGFAVQKIFFTLAGTLVYLYLFFSVSGSFDISFAFVHENPWATLALVVGIALGITALIHAFWAKVRRWWEEAKEGGQVLTHPGAYFLGVFLPEFIAWIAGLVRTAIFMAAYAIPVTFHSLMAVTGSNSIANTVAVTPGGVGIQQTFNVAALKDVTDSQTATAYSVSQQLISTAWSILLAIVLVIWVFGWAGGKALVEESYQEAKAKAIERKAAREADRAAASGAEQGAVASGSPE